jgi:hypothetical protein
MNGFRYANDFLSLQEYLFFFICQEKFYMKNSYNNFKSLSIAYPTYQDIEKILGYKKFKLAFK